ncbi:MAG: MarR family transcriptional regulator [Chloroflexota bacterium]
MKLEDEIDVSIPFKDERDKAIVNLVHTYNVLLEATQRDLKDFNINDQHYNILAILNVEDPQPVAIGQIKQRLLNKRGDLTRLLDKLDHLGWIDRKINPTNRRVMDVTLTAEGRQKLILMDAKLSRHASRRKNLSKEEASQLNHLLDKLRG